MDQRQVATCHEFRGEKPTLSTLAGRQKDRKTGSFWWIHSRILRSQRIIGRGDGCVGLCMSTDIFPVKQQVDETGIYVVSLQATTTTYMPTQH